jgi:outer membrane protein OmpA-like peptidoglycan-associated protein
MLVLFAFGLTIAPPSAMPDGAGAPKIPLCPGLTIVTAVNQVDGDYESIKTIESVTDSAVRMKYSAERLVFDFLSADPPGLKKFTTYRTVRPQDLKSALVYEQVFAEKSPETIPETTAIGTSSAVLEALKSKGQTEFGITNSYGLDLGVDRNVRPNLYDYHMTTTIKRKGQTVPMSVLVNDVRVDLPSIQAEGDFGGDRAEFFFLDDPRNPLTLKFRIGIDTVQPMHPEMVKLCESIKGIDPELLKHYCGRRTGGDKDVLQVVKISHRCPSVTTSPAAGTAVPSLEQSLAKSGRTQVYSIFFTFNSHEIRPESDRTLKEIAEVLQRHGDWKLTIEGHTDNIANDKYNLDLSGRRAAAVKDALIKKYGVAAARLTSSGFGETRPADKNDTIEGRARNRRVELVKQ